MRWEFSLRVSISRSRWESRRWLVWGYEYDCQYWKKSVVSKGSVFDPTYKLQLNNIETVPGKELIIGVWTTTICKIRWIRGQSEGITHGIREAMKAGNFCKLSLLHHFFHSIHKCLPLTSRQIIDIFSQPDFSPWKFKIGYYSVPNKRTGTFWKKLLRLRGGFAWVWSKKPLEILGGTFIRGGTILLNTHSPLRRYDFLALCVSLESKGMFFFQWNTIYYYQTRYWPIAYTERVFKNDILSR